MAFDDRDTFAAHALMGLLAGYLAAKRPVTFWEIASEAYSVADAMIAERDDRPRADGLTAKDVADLSALYYRE